MAAVNSTLRHVFDLVHSLFRSMIITGFSLPSCTDSPSQFESPKRGETVQVSLFPPVRLRISGRERPVILLITKYHSALIVYSCQTRRRGDGGCCLTLVKTCTTAKVMFNTVSNKNCAFSKMENALNRWFDHENS